MNAITDTQQLLVAVREAVTRLTSGHPDFERAWKQGTECFLLWLRSLPATVSPLTRNLELLRCLCEAFARSDFRHDQNLLHLLLEGSIESGQTVSLRGMRWTVRHREVTERYGIRYKLQNEKGEVIDHEFFD